MRTSAPPSLISVAAVLIGVLAATNAFAQALPATPDPQIPPGPPASQIAVPARDVVDVIRELRDKPPKAEPADYTHRMMAAAPVVSYNPANGFGIGAAGNVAFYKGPPETTRISSVVASLTVTSKKQLAFDVGRGNDGKARIYFGVQEAF